MEEIEFIYEHLMKDSFKCNRAEFDFVNADFQRNASKHEIEYPLYVKCALIIYMKKNEQYGKDLMKAIKNLEKSPTIENTDKILIDLHSKDILYL